jgi:hypothetical protein
MPQCLSWRDLPSGDVTRAHDHRPASPAAVALAPRPLSRVHQSRMARLVKGDRTGHRGTHNPIDSPIGGSVHRMTFLNGIYAPRRHYLSSWPTTSMAPAAGPTRLGFADVARPPAGHGEANAELARLQTRDLHGLALTLCDANGFFPSTHKCRSWSIAGPARPTSIANVYRIERQSALELNALPAFHSVSQAAAIRSCQSGGLS